MSISELMFFRNGKEEKKEMTTFLFKEFTLFFPPVHYNKTIYTYPNKPDFEEP